MKDDTLRAERFELVDREGRVRAVLTCGDLTTPSLTFLDTQGEQRVIVGMSWNEMPAIQLNAPDGTARIALIVRPEGMGMAVVTDDQQNSKTLAPSEV